MKAIVQHISVVLFIMLYEVVLKFESVNNLKYDDSNVGLVERGVCFAFICKKKEIVGFNIQVAFCYALK